MKDERIQIVPKLALNVPYSLRDLLLRRLNQVFWLLLLMALVTWGAWRFCQLTLPTPTQPVASATLELQQIQLQSFSSLDSSVTQLRLAVMTGQSQPVLLNLTEQIRQQVHEVSLLSDSDAQLLNQCLDFRQALLRKASPRFLSGQLADLQAQIRYLQNQAAGSTVK